MPHDAYDANDVITFNVAPTATSYGLVYINGGCSNFADDIEGVRCKQTPHMIKQTLIMNELNSHNELNRL